MQKRQETTVLCAKQWFIPGCGPPFLCVEQWFIPQGVPAECMSGVYTEVHERGVQRWVCWVYSGGYAGCTTVGIPRCVPWWVS